MTWKKLGYLLLAGGFLTVLISFLTYVKAFFGGFYRKGNPYQNLKGEQYDKANDRLHALVREFENLPYEQLYITAHDGTKLAAKYYHVADDALFHIQCHGYHGTGLRDFCGGNKLAREAGCNTLVIDQRAHGNSGGNAITFGIKERYDCLDWIHFIVNRYGENAKIIISGVSMGAATVLMTTGLELPENVIGVIADCPFSSPEKIIRKVCEDMKIPSAIGFPFVKLGGKIFGRFDITETDVLEAVKKKKIPMLLIHGEEDGFVPCEMSREIFAAANEPKFLETFPEADHGLSYIIGTERYAEIVEKFVKYCVDRNELLQK